MNDRSAARARTALAWQRTGLGAGALGALLLHTGIELRRWDEVGAAVLALALTALLWLVAWRGHRAPQRDGSADSRAPARLLAVAVLAACTGVLVAASLLR